MGALVAEVAAYIGVVTLTCWPWRPVAYNEPDVLPFARHRADPSWLPADWYLGRDIPYRAAFDAVVGPVAAAHGLSAAATVGRLLSYVLMAAALVALLRVLRVSRWLAVAPIALFLTHQDLVAGEWMVGGAESKALAYPAVVGAVAAAAARRHGWCGLLLGAALSMHALVGVWASVALVLGAGLAATGRRPTLSKEAAARFAVGYVVTGGWGLWVVLRTLLDRDDGSYGWDIYVRFRVAHHVLPESWSTDRAIPWQVWVVLAVVGALLVLVRATWAWRVVAGVVVTSCTIFAAGLGLDAAGRTELLRFYWFRLADTWVPLAASLALAAALTAVWSRGTTDRHGLLLRGTTGLVVALAVLTVTIDVAGDRRVARAAQARQQAGSERAAMQWVADNLPLTAVVAADPSADRWYVDADRATIALYKASPQSARDVETWAARLGLLSGADLANEDLTRRDLRGGHRRLGGPALQVLCEAGATHYVARRSSAPAPAVLLHLQDGWGVFRLVGPDGTCPRTSAGG